MITVKDLTLLQATILGFDSSRRLTLGEFAKFLHQIVSVQAWKEPVSRDKCHVNIRDHQGQGSITLDLKKALPTEMSPILDKVAEFLRVGMPYALSGVDWIMFGSMSEATLSEGDAWGYRLDPAPSDRARVQSIRAMGYPSPGLAKLAAIVQALQEWQVRPTGIQAETRKWISRFDGDMSSVQRAQVCELPLPFAYGMELIQGQLSEHTPWATMELKQYLTPDWHLSQIQEGPKGEIALTLVRKDGGAIIEDSVETGFCSNFDSALFFGTLIAFAKDKDAGRDRS